MKKLYTKKKSVAPQEMEVYLRRWEQKAHGFVKVYAVGENPMAGPIWCAEFSDPNIPNEDKYNAMVVASHSGAEISGCNAVLSVGNFLATFNETSKKILSKNRVFLVPCPVPDNFGRMLIDDGEQYITAKDINRAYANFANNDDASIILDENGEVLDKMQEVYSGRSPWISTFCKMVDELHPEITIDVHGVWFEEAIMPEYFGQLSASSTNYTTSRAFVDDLQRVTEAAGYAIVNEDDIQCVKAMTAISHSPKWRNCYWHANNNLMVHNYSYLKYHTMNICMESAFSGSSMTTIIRALEKGAEEGYPVDTMDFSGYDSFFRSIGETVQERRESRAELWWQSIYFGKGIIYPQFSGIAGTLLNNGLRAHRDEVFNTEGGLDCSIDKLCDLLDSKGYDTAEMRKSFDNEMNCWIRSTGSPHSRDYDPEGKAVTKHGITIRLSVPYKDAKIKEVWFNGMRMTEADGYKIVRERNWTYVDILIKGQIPDQSFAMCKYDYTPHPSGIIEF